MKNYYDLLSKHYGDCRKPVEGVISQSLLTSGEIDLGRLAGVIQHPRITVIGDQQMGNIETIGESDIAKYPYIGCEQFRPLDFVITDGISSQALGRIWAYVKVGGYAIGMDKHKLVVGSGKNVVRKKKWVAISGCHRGGTTYMAQLLTACGLHVGHQDYARDGVVSGSLSTTVFPAETTNIHIVRNPIKCIESLTGVIHRVLKGFPVCPVKNTGDSELLLSMKYYYWLHSLAKLRGLWTVRVEDVQSRWKAICKRLDIPFSEYPELSATVNARTYTVKAVSWGDLYNEDEYLAECIKTLSVEHGYWDDIVKVMKEWP